MPPPRGKGKFSKDRKPKRNQQSLLFRRKRFCRFTVTGVTEIDYKDVDTLRDFISENGKITPAHAWGTALIAWAGLSLIWTANIYDGIDAFLKLLILAGLFRIGAASESLRRFFIGASAGMSISSAVAIAQFLGWNGIAQSSIWPSGLFINSILMGEAAALVLVGCAVYRLWWLIPGLLPALSLSMCRGAFAALLAVGVIRLWQKSRLAAVAVALIAAVIVLGIPSNISSIISRLDYWHYTIPQITPFGHGLGSFYTLYPTFGGDTFLERPEHAHNDWIELTFELGAIGAIIFLAFISSLGRGPLAYVFVAFVVECCFGFGSHMAVTGCIATLCAGHLARGRADIRDVFHAGGIPLCQWHDEQEQH